MLLEGVDLVKLSKLTSQQVDNVTCLECCKYYIAPETAACGHTLCHSCWRGRRSCPTCAVPLERRSLKFNLPIQSLTEHVHQLGEAFEKLFNVKLDEFILDTPNNVESENCPTKNVKDWLASSQNHFSAPVVELNSQETLQDPCNPLEVSSSKIQIHVGSKKEMSPKKVAHVSVPQDDWDKIETIPETEVLVTERENIVGPMDIEPYFIEDNAYTVEHPRRSSRKRDLKAIENDITSENPSSKDSSGEIDKKSNKIKQNWSNVKRMRKEFSKLNKINRNKLNVSIEMCKKTQNTVNKSNLLSPIYPDPPIQIDDNTPRIVPVEKNNTTQPIVDVAKSDMKTTETSNITIDNSKNVLANNVQNNKDIQTENDFTMEESNEKIENNNNLTDNKHSGSVKSCNKVDHVDNTKKPTKMPFIKKGALCINNSEEKYSETTKQHNETKTSDSDNIEITIKIGNTVTNIFIKKKEKDIDLKLNSDKQIQTSMGSHSIFVSNNKLTKDVEVQTTNMNTYTMVDKAIQPTGNEFAMNSEDKQPLLEKPESIKKQTASADTATAQFEITDSVEKELSKIMECKEPDRSRPIRQTAIAAKTTSTVKSAPVICNQNEMDCLNDLDIFDSGSVNENNVHWLKNTKPTASEILVPTVRTIKDRTQKIPNKRDREIVDEDNMPNKKIKIISEEVCKGKHLDNISATENNPVTVEPDSENYDAIMSQVFANIDADIEHIHRTRNFINSKAPNKETLTQSLDVRNEIVVSSPLKTVVEGKKEVCTNEKYSENVFSAVEKENADKTLIVETEGPESMKQHVQDLLTPVLVCNLEATNEALQANEVMGEKNTPLQEYDDSDKSVVEDTPQKNVSFSKLKQKNSVTNQSQRVSIDEKVPATEKLTTDTQYIKSIINITDTDTLVEARSNVTIIDTAAKKQTMETPLTINKFVGDIKHKSTPVARKSLNFIRQNNDDEDPEQTLCQTSEIVAKNTQEKEFMCKAFEKSLSPTIKPPPIRFMEKGGKNFCIAGSCLTSVEIAKLKYLCSEQKWTYLDKYTEELTHLVVGVDKENKAQRSVKYMCALAAGKWIIRFQWVEKCLKLKTVVSEGHYEAYDSTGEHGPQRSRIASNCNRKLFQGITFYCMPPFSVLDVDTLKGMLEAAGGVVAEQTKGVRVAAGQGPALLLAEPEHTQEDRFLYLAMELSVVPVNYEWVLNCLGSYTLSPVNELLLCPTALLPAPTAKWPHEIISHYDD